MPFANCFVTQRVIIGNYINYRRVLDVLRLAKTYAKRDSFDAGKVSV
jgi:hypothetical protein